jgi:hypothetical protein
VTGPEHDDTVAALRAELGARIATLTPPIELYETVRRRHRRRQAAAVAGVAAAVLVGVGVPVGLARSTAAPAATTPTPTRPAVPCIGASTPGPGAPTVPPPVPASRLPGQPGVLGSLAGDRALVDAAAVAGWQGFQREAVDQTNGARTMAAGTVRVRFVERAGAGILALATATDTTGRWQAVEWVTGSGRTQVPVGGRADVPGPGDYDRRLGQLYWGDDPLYIAAQQVCGVTYGVVLAPPDATATITGTPHIGADARPVPGPSRSVAVSGGLAVVPVPDAAGATVTVSRGGTVLATRALDAERGFGSGGRRGATAEQIAQAVRDGPRSASADLVRAVVPWIADDAVRRITDRVTGVRVVWGGRWTHRQPGALIALRLPSGADYLAFVVRMPAQGGSTSYSSEFSGLLPAGRLGDTVFTWRSGTTLAVIDPRAAWAEADLDDDRTIPVPLTDGAGLVVVPGGRAKVTEVRTYDSGGTELGHATPGSVLLDLPRQ